MFHKGDYILDRRTAYTRMVIKQAFLTLLNTHKLEQITVKEICFEANINRATFYRNFKDIYDLFEEIEHEMIQEAFPNGSSDFDLNQLLEVIYNNQTFYKEFFDNHLQSTLISSMIEDLQKSFAKTLKENNVFNEQDYNAYFHFALYGATGLLKSWISQGCVPPPNDFSPLLLKICYGLFDL